VNPKSNQTRMRLKRFAIAVLTTLMATGNHADATDRRGERPVESIASRPAGDPIIAIVSLQSQRITIYDRSGWILRAPVSSGQKERETPAGIFSVIQKDADHHSNLYDDAFMPHMQRLTWSGIALHGGLLPGYAASHGCVRMPFDFAEHLFDMTELGLRVIVAPTDAVPVEIIHPALLLSKPGAGALAAARTAEADEAGRKADQARLAAGAAFREAAQAMAPVRMAENLRLRADAQLTAAEMTLGSANSVEAKEQAERAKSEAVAKLADLQVQLAAAKADMQPKLDALAAAREASVVAETEQVAATKEARQVVREREPVSVLISRKTQRLYVRQAFEPILESPVTILDVDRFIGTHIFTAVEPADGEANMRWNVVSLVSRRSPPSGENQSQTRAGGGRDRDIEPVLTDSDSAKSALDRIVIPQDVLDRIAGIAPRSSLIITDEAPSSETGKGTDFVVVLSGELQGGIKIRQRSPGPEAGFRYDLPRNQMRYWRSPVAGP
jgi:L,D-transpeptidase catalytic domain